MHCTKEDVIASFNSAKQSRWSVFAENIDLHYGSLFNGWTVWRFLQVLPEEKVAQSVRDTYPNSVVAETLIGVLMLYRAGVEEIDPIEEVEEEPLAVIPSFQRSTGGAEFMCTASWDSSERGCARPAWVGCNESVLHRSLSPCPLLLKTLFKGKTLCDVFGDDETASLVTALSSEELHAISEEAIGECGGSLTTYYWCPRGTLTIHHVHY